MKILALLRFDADKNEVIEEGNLSFFSRSRRRIASAFELDGSTLSNFKVKKKQHQWSN